MSTKNKKEPAEVTADSIPKLIFDFEVYKHDWMMGYIILNSDPRDDKYNNIINDSAKLKKFVKEHIHYCWIGYNSGYYDKWILSAILSNTEDVYDISAQLVAGTKPWTLNIPIYPELINYDCMYNHKSLKELEGHLGVNIHESEIDFNINRELTAEELATVGKYNMDDVVNTKLVFTEQYNDFKAKFDILKLLNLSLPMYMDRTLASCIATALNPNSKPELFEDEFDITVPDCINLGKYEYLRNWHKEHPYNPNKEYKKDEDKPKLKFNTKSMDCVIGWGGIHGAIENKKYQGKLISVDVSSLYPSLMVKYGYCSRNMLNRQLYEHCYDENLRLKKLHDPKRGSYKLICNSTYGTFKAEHNRLYDPRSANNIVVAGQLMLLDLIDKLEDAGIKLYQANTDGVIFEDVGDWQPILDDWQERTRLTLEVDKLTELYQIDVNNYVAKFENGSIKGKGRFFSSKSKLDNDLPIINRAIIEKLINDVPIADTINNCTELIQFQHIAKCTNKYDCFSWNDSSSKRSKPILGKTFRVFASTNDKHSAVYKVKLGGSREKLSYTSKCSFVCNDDVTKMKTPDYLDKEYYIDQAKKYLKKLKSTGSTVGTGLNNFANGIITPSDEEEACKSKYKRSESKSTPDIHADDVKTESQDPTPPTVDESTAEVNTPPIEEHAGADESQSTPSIGLAFDPKEMLKNIPDVIGKESHYGLFIVHNFNPFTNKANKKPVFIKQVGDKFILHEGKGEYFNSTISEVTKWIGKITMFDKIYSGGSNCNYDITKMKSIDIMQPAYLMLGWYFGKETPNSRMIAIDIDKPNAETVELVKNDIIPNGYTESSCSGAYHVLCLLPENYNLSELGIDPSDGKVTFSINNGSEIEIFIHSNQLNITGNIISELKEPIRADETIKLLEELFTLSDVTLPDSFEVNNIGEGNGSSKGNWKPYEHAPKCYDIFTPMEDDGKTPITELNSKDSNGKPAMKGKHPIIGGETAGGNLTVGEDGFTCWHNGIITGGLFSAIAIMVGIIKWNEIKFGANQNHCVENIMSKRQYAQVYDYIESREDWKDWQAELKERSSKVDTTIFYNEKGQLLWAEVAQYLIKKHHVCRPTKTISDANILYYYDGMVYHILSNTVIKNLCTELIPTISTHYRNEIIENIRSSLNTIPVVEFAGDNYIMFANGIYNVNTKELGGFTPELLIRNQIPWNYNANAYDEKMDKTLIDWFGDETPLRKLIEEMIGISLLPTNKYQKHIICIGQFGTGKTTFVETVLCMLGEDDNVQPLKWKQISERFMMSKLNGKLACYIKEVPKIINDSDDIKDMTCGSNVTAEDKNGQPYVYTPYATIWGTANQWPRWGEDAGALEDRFIMIPFKKRYGRGGLNSTNKPNLLKELKASQSAMEYLAKCAVDGLQRLISNKGKFNATQDVINETLKLKIESNVVLQFLSNPEVIDWIKEQFVIEGSKLVNKNELYDRFIKFCESELKITDKDKIMKKIPFSKKLKDTYVGLSDKTTQGIVPKDDHSGNVWKHWYDFSGIDDIEVYMNAVINK